jgi:hypothetical protein
MHLPVRCPADKTEKDRARFVAASEGSATSCALTSVTDGEIKVCEICRSGARFSRSAWSAVRHRVINMGAFACVSDVGGG